MKASLLALFVLATQGVNAAKNSASGKRENGTDTNVLESGTLRPKDTKKSLDSLLELGKGLNLEQLNAVLSSKLEEGFALHDAWVILSDSPLFLQDQSLLIEEALKENYEAYLKCMMLVDRPWWRTEEERHEFLMQVYGAPWCDSNLWDAHKPYLNWEENADAFFKADNVAFAVAHPEICEKLLSDPTKIAEFVVKHDSVNLAKHFIKDLSVFTDKVVSMAKFGSVKLFRLLSEQDIPLDISQISPYSNNDREFLYLLYENGLTIGPKSDSLDVLMERGDHALISLMSKVYEKPLPSRRAVAEAAKQGRLEAVKWAVGESSGLLPKEKVIDDVFRNGHLDMMQWLLDQYPQKEIPCGVLESVFHSARLDILNWAWKRDPNFLNRCSNEVNQVIAKACTSGEPKNVNWPYQDDLESHGEEYDLKITAKNDHLNLLKLLYEIDSKNLPAVGQLNCAAAGGFLDILKWVHSKNRDRIPDIDGANGAARGGHIPVLEWLASMGVHPDRKGLDDCVETGRVESLRWMMQKFPEMKPSSQKILKAAKTGRLGVIKYIHSTKRKLLDDPIFKWADENWEWKEIVDFLIEIGKRPNPKNNIDAKSQQRSINENFAAGDGRASALSKERTLVGLDEGQDLKQLNADLEGLGKDLEVDDAWEIMSNSAVFEQDQISLIKEAVNEGHNSFLKYMLMVDRSWWKTEKDYHWFLALSYGASWCDEFLWNAHRPHLIWKESVDALFKEDNLAFAIANPEIFKFVPNDPALIDEFIKHDSVNLATHYIKDLNIFTSKVVPMVKLGSVKLLRLLLERGIPLNISAISLQDACRNVKVLRLLYENGYDVTPSKDRVDLLMKEGKFEPLEFFYKIDTKNLPGRDAVASAASRGQLEAVKWAVGESSELLPGEDNIINAVAIRGHLAMLQWIFDQGSQKEIPCSAILSAVLEGHVDILNWANEKDEGIIKRCSVKFEKMTLRRGSHPYYSCKSGKTGGVKWSCNKSLVLPFTKESVADAVMRNQLNLLKLFYEINPKNLPKVNQLYYAAAGGFLDILKWVHSKDRDRIPDIDGANGAARNGHIPVLNWLASMGVHPDRRGLDDCVETGKVESLRWMMQKFPEMKPSSQEILKAAKTGRLGVIRHIHKTRPDLLDYPVLLAAAKTRGWDRTADFLENCLPAPVFPLESRRRGVTGRLRTFLPRMALDILGI